MTCIFFVATTRMHFRIIQPNAVLQPFIKEYCVMESDKGEGDITERVVPTPNLQLMFHFRKPFRVHASEIPGYVQPKILVSGLSSSFSDVSTSGAAGVVFISFLPEGACRFFRFPLTELENHSIALQDIDNHTGNMLEAQFEDQPTMEDRIRVIEAFLMQRFSRIPGHDEALIRHGLRLIADSKGQLRASSLADRLGTTPKSLTRKFTTYVGKTPKQYIRLVRFQETIRDLQQGKIRSLTEYAGNSGYFDQAHFIHDFSTLAGMTPKEFTTRYGCCATADQI